MENSPTWCSQKSISTSRAVCGKEVRFIWQKNVKIVGHLKNVLQVLDLVKNKLKNIFKEREIKDLSINVF